MNILEAIILGVIQGLTEFLPVSSSGHLELAKVILGVLILHGIAPYSLSLHIPSIGFVLKQVFIAVLILASVSCV